jgi:hypothetical protein
MNNAEVVHRLQQEKRELLSSGLYEENESLIAELNRSILEASTTTDKRSFGFVSTSRN